MSFLKSLLGATTTQRPESTKNTPDPKTVASQNVTTSSEGKSDTQPNLATNVSQSMQDMGNDGTKTVSTPSEGTPQPSLKRPSQDLGISTALSRLGSAFSSALLTSPASEGTSTTKPPGSTKQADARASPHGDRAPSLRMPPEIQRQTARYSEGLFESIRLLFNWSGYVESEANRMCELYGFWKERGDPQHVHLDRLNKFLDDTIPREYYLRETPTGLAKTTDTTHRESSDIVSAENISTPTSAPPEPSTSQTPHSGIATIETPASPSAVKPIPASQRGLPQQAALALYDAHRMRSHLDSQPAQTTTLSGLRSLTQATSDLTLKLKVVIEAANAKRESRTEQRKKAEADFVAASNAISETYAKKKSDLMAFHERNMNSLKQLESSPLPLPALQVSVSLVPDATQSATPTVASSQAQRALPPPSPPQPQSQQRPPQSTASEVTPTESSEASAVQTNETHHTKPKVQETVSDDAKVENTSTTTTSSPSENTVEGGKVEDDEVDAVASHKKQPNEKHRGKPKR